MERGIHAAPLCNFTRTLFRSRFKQVLKIVRSSNLGRFGKRLPENSQCLDLRMK